MKKKKIIIKKKIAEIEKNLREAEGKRGALLLESEKEKAKWDIEKDNLYNKVSELNDKIQTLEKKNESLLRENERLKNEKNNLRNRGYNKNNESRYVSHISGGVFRSKIGGGDSYKSSMLKALGDYSEDKSETSDKSNNTNKSNANKNNDKKEDTKK